MSENLPEQKPPQPETSPAAGTPAPARKGAGRPKKPPADPTKPAALKKVSPEANQIDEVTGLPKWLTSDQLAWLAGVDRTRLHQLVKDGRLPPPAGPKHAQRWDAGATLKKLFEYYRERGAKGGGKTAMEAEELLALRIKNAKMLGHLLPVAVVTKAFSSVLAVLRARITAARGKLPESLYTAAGNRTALKEVVDKEIDELLHALHEIDFEAIADAESTAATLEEDEENLTEEGDDHGDDEASAVAKSDS